MRLVLSVVAWWLLCCGIEQAELSVAVLGMEIGSKGFVKQQMGFALSPLAECEVELEKRLDEEVELEIYLVEEAQLEIPLVEGVQLEIRLEVERVV